MIKVIQSASFLHFHGRVHMFSVSEHCTMQLLCIKQFNLLSEKVCHRFSRANFKKDEFELNIYIQQITDLKSHSQVNASV
jgi:hypothetical protein